MWYRELWAFQVALVVKNLPANVRDSGSIPGSGRSPRGGYDNPSIPVFLPGESHGQGSLVGCSSWGRKESDTTD